MRDWNNIVISPECSIEAAIKLIDEQGERIVLVVDDSKLLKGTITDGDVRRGMLKGISLRESCQKIMSVNPICSTPHSTRIQLRTLFDKHQILHLPIVDDEGILCGLETLQEHVHIEYRRDNPVFLMAGGFGTRLRPLTDSCPKPMLKIGAKPILQLIVESFIKSGFHRFYISTHYMPEIIEAHFGDGSDWNVSIEYIYEDEPLGTGGALGLLPHNDINHPLIMMNGDLLTDVNFVELVDFHVATNTVGTMCIREYEQQVPFGVIETDGTNILSMIEKPTQKFNVNAGIYVLSPELVKSVNSGTKVDMPTLLKQEIESGNYVSTFPIHEYWLDIGRKEDFNRAQIDAGNLLNV